MKKFSDFILDEKYQKIERSAFGGTKSAIKKKIFDLELKSLQSHIEKVKTGPKSEKSIQRNIGRLKSILAHEEVEHLEEMPGANMDTRAVHAHLKKKGWVLSRSSGGHDVYTHPKAPNHISVPRHKHLKAPLVRGILKQSEVHSEEVQSVDEQHSVIYKMKKEEPKMSVAQYKSKDDAHKFLDSVKKKGGNGIVRSKTNEEVEQVSEGHRYHEHEHEYELERRFAASAKEPHHVYINGKVWKKDGRPVEFSNKNHAMAAGNSIVKKDPSKKVHITHHTYTEKHNGILEEFQESAAWQRKEGKNPEGGLNQKGVDSYRREHPGSKLQTAVTKDPSKLKKGSKSAKRRLSFCRRMRGMKDKLTSAETARDPDSRINKSLRKWNC